MRFLLRPDPSPGAPGDGPGVEDVDQAPASYAMELAFFEGNLGKLKVKLARQLLSLADCQGNYLAASRWDQTSLSEIQKTKVYKNADRLADHHDRSSVF